MVFPRILFNFLKTASMAFAKTLEDEWTPLGIIKYQFARKDNSPRSTGQLVRHWPGTFSSGILFDLFCMIHVDNGAFFFGIQDLHWKRDHPPFQILSSVWTWNAHQHGKKPQRLNAYFSCPQDSVIHEHYRSIISPPPTFLYRTNRVRKRDAHMRTKNMPSAVKQQLSK